MPASPGFKPQLQMPTAEQVLPLERLRARRRHPRRTQFDYLHLRRLADDIGAALGSIGHPVRDVLDVYCGTRPYDDLMPAGATVTGLDIADPYGVVDVVSDEFLPFADASFDLVVCFQAFYFREDPVASAAEIARVLRPGGTAVVTVPFALEYDPQILERRFTGPEIAAVFDGWHDVTVVENGGRAVTWTMTTARLVQAIERRCPSWTRAAFSGLYAVLNAFGGFLDRQERRGLQAMHLPPNVLVTARRPG